MVEKLAHQLRTNDQCCSVITIKLRYSNFDTHTQQCKLPYTNLDHILIEKAKELFDKLYQRRMLIRLVGVRLSGLINGGPQMNLFEDSTEMANLYKAMDLIKNKFGTKAVSRASGV